MQNRESLFKYQSCIYNVQSNSDVKHSGMKMRWNNKTISSLNLINGISSTYEINGILRQYNYWSDPKLGLGIVLIRILQCICHACKTIFSLSWY